MPVQTLFSYNFHSSDLPDQNFHELFNHRRRDAAFAFAYVSDGNIYALRDHLGIVPLYYRIEPPHKVRFATNLDALVLPSDTLDPDGTLAYLKFGTPKLMPLVKEIGIVPPGTVIQIDPNSASVQVIYTYKLKPRKLSPYSSMKQLAEEFENLFAQAVQRLIREDAVGLYLSGGIDSALIGIYLQKAGVSVRAYTSAPWGHASSEIPYAQTNAKLISAIEHTIDVLEASYYPEAISDIPTLYRQPHGTSTAIGVSSLWRHTSIAQEKQLFFGQNSDTMLCSVPAQYLAYFVHCLPRALRVRFHPAFRHDNLVTDYLALARGYSGRWDALCFPPEQTWTKVQKLSYLGMLVAHTPSDGEVLLQPALNRGMLVSNPYYDVDLIEFSLGIPLRHRLKFTRSSKLKVILEKRILRHLALRYIPRDIVYRKKGFTISFQRDVFTKQFAQTFPTKIGDIPLVSAEERFAAAILSQWQSEVFE